MKRIFWVLVLVGLSGCGKNLRPDESIPSLSANYPSAEFYACGQRFVGVGHCEIEVGTDVESLGFGIQGYYKGRIRVYSDALPADVIMNYEGSETVYPGISGVPLEDIIVQFIINPEYPGEYEDAVPIFGAMGFLHIKVKFPGEVWHYKMTRTPVETDPILRVNTLDAESVTIVSKQCDVDKTIDADSDITEIRLSSLIDNRSKKTCAFTVGVVGANPHLWMWDVWLYAKNFRALGIPVVELDDDEISVVGEKGVTVVSLDGESEIDFEAEFDFDPQLDHVLRLMTLKGRIIVGEWSKGKWTWKN